MQNWQEHLAATLTGRICVLGVGNRMKADDGAGSLLVDRLSGHVRADCVDAGVAPENYLEKVARTRPEVVLIVDAADFGGEPGEIRFFTGEEVAAAGISTHAQSLDLTVRYLRERGVPRVVLVAIQPACVSLAAPMTPAVSQSVETLAGVLSDVLPRV